MYKRLLLIILNAASLILNSVAQPPQAFNYQAVARDNLGVVLPNHTIALRFSILDNSSSGSVLYSETFTSATNQFGLFTVNLGTGAVVSGVFSTINWASGSKWLQTEMDIDGGSNFTLMGSSQFLSVPYALYAAKSGFSYSQNTTTSVSPLGDTLFIGDTYVIIPGISMANACRTDYEDTIPYTLNHPHAGDNPYNSALYGLPKFILKDYIELDKIDSISRFRSGIGHDYSDDYEACRSMKHYFKPQYDVDWGAVKIFSPVNGIVTNTFPETIGGNQIAISPFGMPAFNVTIFHVNYTVPVNIGDTLWAGQQIGTHTGPQTTSDIAIRVNASNNTQLLVSYFDVMTDRLFACYMSRGVISREELIITKEDRDADPLLPCNGYQFFVHGTIENWVTLQ